MVTKEQAMSERVFHYGECSKTIGPRGGVKESIMVVMANGQCKVWKTRPRDFRLPVKRGLRDYWHIDPINAHLFHVEGECPLNREQHVNTEKALCQDDYEYLTKSGQHEEKGE